MPERKFGIDLKSYDDIFKTEEEREEDKLSKIRDIPISEIDDFPDHPFMVRDDEDMQNLIESIKERGVITPAMVRKKEDGRYELISGENSSIPELTGNIGTGCCLLDILDHPLICRELTKSCLGNLTLFISEYRGVNIVIAGIC